jgi:hypothetical protein
MYRGKLVKKAKETAVATPAAKKSSPKKASKKVKKA